MSGIELSSSSLNGDANLRAYYKMDSGALTTDSSGVGNTLTNVNTVGESSSGKFGYTADYGTANSSKTLATATNVFSATQPTEMSVSMWVKLRTEISTGTYRFCEINTALDGTATNGSDLTLEYQYNSGTRRLRAFWALTTTSADAYYNIALGTSDWYHIVQTTNGATSNLYVNGNLVATNTGSGTPKDSASGTYKFALGASRVNNTWSSIYQDDVAVFERALTDAEINELYYDSPQNGNWTSSLELQSDNTKVSGSSDLTDFPALISDSNLSSAVYAGLRQGGSNVTATNLETSGSDANQTSYTTGSISPSPQRMILVSVGSVQSPGTVATPTISGCSMTWTQVATAVEGGNLRRTTVFRGVSDNPTSGALTIDFGGNTQLRAIWSITELNNVDIGGTNGSNAIVQSASTVQSDATNYTGVTVTLGAFSSTKNATFGAVSCDNSGGISPGSGFTELGEHLAESVRAIETEWRNDNDTSVDWSWSSQPSRAVAIALELKYKNQGGEDLRITTDSAGTTEVPFEIVGLDTSAETCEIWAKVPTLSYNSATSLFIWYGNSSALPYSATDTYGSQNVWSDYQLVYHFDGSTILDSTANANTGTNSGTTLDTSGKIGSAREWDTAGDYITGGSGTSIDDTFASGATIMTWLNPDSDGISNTFGYIAEKKATNGWIFSVDPLSGSDLPFVFIHDFSTARGKWTSTTASLPINTWSHAVLKYNNGSTANNPTALINGSSVAFTENETPSGTRSDDSSSTLYLGQNDGGLRTWDGHIDEFRIRDGETTTDWDLTEYNNQNSPSTFWTAVSGVTFTPSVMIF